MSPTDIRGSADRELRAISAILKAIHGLDGESIQRVFDYVFGRLSLSRPRAGLVSASSSLSPSASGTVDVGGEHRRVASIRDLKEEKKPDSSNQMAALVAYYLSEMAPSSERTDVVGATELKTYFKQAGFKLPKSMGMTLPNAAASGYFDAMGGGRYRLNPVGYNLVVHGLPRDEGKASTGAKKRKTRTAKKARTTRR